MKLKKGMLVLSAMEGICNGTYAKTAGKGAGLVTLGGFNADQKSIDTGKPFSPKGESAQDWLEREVPIAKENGALVAVNTRATTADAFVSFSKLLDNAGANILEIDAHCNSKMMHNIGIGHYLIRHPEKLTQFIRDIKKKTDFPVSVKCATHVIWDKNGKRGGFGEFAKKLVDAGADLLHFDIRWIRFPLYYVHRPDYSILEDVKKHTDTFLIASGTVNSLRKYNKFVRKGADGVAVATATLKDRMFIPKLAEEIKNQKDN